MGWSCSRDAGNTMDLLTERCVKETGCQNTFLSARDEKVKYFWERSNKEYSDGRITGSVWKMLDDGTCKKTGSFRINGDGSVARFTALHGYIIAMIENHSNL